MIIINLFYLFWFSPKINTDFPAIHIYYYLASPETLLKRLKFDDPCFRLPVFVLEFPLLEAIEFEKDPNPLWLVWLLNTTWPSERVLYTPLVSFPSTALLPPKNDDLRFSFLLARKAIERLPEVFWNNDLLPVELDLDNLALRWRFLERGPKLLLVSEDCELRRESEEERRTRPQRIWLNSSFMLTSSSMRRCWENSWLSLYISSRRCILARFVNRLARRSCDLTSSSWVSSGFSGETLKMKWYRRNWSR